MEEADGDKTGVFMKRFILKLLMRSLITVILVTLLLKGFPIEEVKRMFVGMRPMQATFFLIFSAMMIAESTWKWHFLLGRAGIKKSWWSLYRTYLVAYLYTNLLPSNVGGDVYRIMKVAGNQRAQSFTAVFAERGSGLIGLVFFSCLSLFIMPAHPRKPLLAVIILFFFLGCLGMIGSLFSNNLLHLGTSILRKYRMGKIADKLERVVAALRLLGKDPKGLLGMFIFTVAFYMMVPINVGLAFAALGVDVSASSLMAGIYPVMLISMIPITINGIGLTEGAYVFCLGIVGIDPVAILSMALLIRIRGILVGLVGGLLYLLGWD